MPPVQLAGRRRFSKATLAALASVACGCVRVPARPTTLVGGHGQVPALPDRFEVLCWNIHKNADAAQALDRIGSDPDLVLLQESVATAEAPPGHATLVVAFRRARDDRPAGVMTVSQATPSSSTALLSDTLEPLVRTPKSALVSMVPLARGGELLVANVHGVNFRRADALRGQLDELDPLLRAHTQPAIVAGDFNTWSPARRAALSAFAQRHGLRSVFEGDGAPRLDAILYRGLDPEGARVIPSKDSDHNALRVWFVVSPSGRAPRD